MVPNSDFQSPFSVNAEPQNNELDFDVTYYQDQISSFDDKYYVPGEVKDQIKSLQLNSFSVLYLNIGSMRNLGSFSRNFRFKFPATMI